VDHSNAPQISREQDYSYSLSYTPPPEVKIHSFKVLNSAECEVRKKKLSQDLEKTKKEVRFILNKITPENFQKLSAEILSIPLTSYEMIGAVAELIFEKAIQEYKFNKLYAKLVSYF
jgi:hypothetical protein